MSGVPGFVFPRAGAAVAGSSDRSRALAFEIARLLGMEPFEIADADGNVTTFGQPTAGTPTDAVPVSYQPVGSRQPTSQPNGNPTTYSWEVVPGSSPQAKRVTRVLAPVPAGTDGAGSSGG